EPTGTTETTSYDPPENLDISTIYLWKVVAVGSPGETPGPTWTFTTGDGGPPGVPEFPYPDHNQLKVPVGTALYWDPAASALTYELYIWPASGTKPTEPIWTGAGTT